MAGPGPQGRTVSDEKAKAEALGEECDRFGLPHDVGTLVKHIEGNRAATEAALAMSNSLLREKLEAAESRLREMGAERDEAVRLLRVALNAHITISAAIAELAEHLKRTAALDDVSGNGG